MAGYFIIPKGVEYIFTTKIMAKESFIAQDLTHMSGCTFQILDGVSGCPYSSNSISSISPTVTDAVNGILSFSLPSTYTTNLDVWKGEAVDGYYLRPKYQGIIQIEFNDGTPTIFSLIQKIYVTNTGCIA